MLSFQNFLTEAKDNLHGKVGGDGKATGHVRDYILPMLSAQGRAKTMKSVSNVGDIKVDTSVAGSHHDPKAESTHVLASKFENHPAGTPVKITHVTAGGEDGRSLFAHTESHGTIPLSRIAKPAALKKKAKGTGGFDVENRINSNFGTKSAGSSSTGFDFHYTGGSKSEKPAVRGKVKMVEQEQKKAVKGVDRPDVRGESKLVKGKFGQSIVNFEKGKGWSFGGKSKMNPMFERATVTGSDGKERTVLDHLNTFHKKGVIDRGFTARAAKGTASHYLGSSEINTVHFHNRQVDDNGNTKVDRGTTYTVGDTSLKGKTNLSHLSNSDIDRLDGSLNVLSTKTGKAEVTHRPSQGVMREYADNSHNDPTKHRSLIDENHAAEFRKHVDKHIKEYQAKKKQIKEDAVAVPGGSGSTNISNVAGIRDGEIPPVGKGITTAKKLLRRKYSSFLGK